MEGGKEEWRTERKEIDMQTWREGLTDTARAATGECLNAVKGESGDDGMDGPHEWTDGRTSILERALLPMQAKRRQTS